jgi:hypothetical protein
MKNKMFPVLVVLGMALALTGCSKGPDADDKPKASADAGTNSADADAGKGGVTVDAETQGRFGLKIATPAAAQWQPQMHAVGWVVDTPALVADASDYAAAQAAAGASQNDLERTRKLAEENNASTRALETAQAAAAHDVMALKALQAKFRVTWGAQLAGATNLVDMVEAMATNGTTLVKVTLPAGMAVPSPIGRATVQLLADDAALVPAAFTDDLGIDPATQQETLLFTAEKPLPPRAAVTVTLETGGTALSGVEVPAEAVLRHEGKGWVYEQTGTNQFQRVEVPLDRQTANGWFMAEGLTTTNQIVVTGGQTILSTELSGSIPAGD